MSSGKFRQIVGLVLLASLACTTFSCTVASSKESFSVRRLLPSETSFAMSPATNPRHSIRLSATANPKLDSTWRFTKAWLNIIRRHSLRNPLSLNAGG